YIARWRAETRIETSFPRRERARTGAARAGDRGAGPETPRAAEPQWRGRDDVPAAADRIRRGRPDAGRTQAGAVSQGMERQRRSGLPRVCILSNPPRFAPAARRVRGLRP